MRVESRGGAGVELVQEVDALCKGRTPSDLVDFSWSDLATMATHFRSTFPVTLKRIISGCATNIIRDHKIDHVCLLVFPLVAWIHFPHCVHKLPFPHRIILGFPTSPILYLHHASNKTNKVNPYKFTYWKFPGIQK